MVNLIKCYIVDFEGYPTKNSFLFKEIAICDPHENSFQNYFLKTPYLNSKTYNYLLKNHHHIPYLHGNTDHKTIFKKLNLATIIFIVKVIKNLVILKNILKLKLLI